jgi:thiamine biosynthesis lipoprotein ApbE/Na+-translocating ferredoxin:NAD+ oxidoreductase RnfG subunit
VEAAFREIARLEQLLSIYRADSEISKINRGILSDDPEILSLLAIAEKYTKITNGAFDIRCGAFAAVGKISGGLDLGAIGKGYAIDRAVNVLNYFGITRAKISCKSTIYGRGTPPGLTGWPVTIESPNEGASISITLCNQAISTSGNAEQFGHITNPKTKAPITANGIYSASVLAKMAAESDALSTALYVIGEKAERPLREGFLLFEKMPDIKAAIIRDDGQTVTTSAWPKGLSRRQFLTRAAIFLFAIALPSFSWGATVYLTEEEALAKMMPDADHFETKEMTLTAEQQKKAELLAGRSFSDPHFRYIVGKKGDHISYAFPIEVIGKVRPITLLIGIHPDGSINAIEVLIYRESQGSEVRYHLFLSQFKGKKKEDALRLGNDIQSISGATLSSRGVTYATRKALALFDAVTQISR